MTACAGWASGRRPRGAGSCPGGCTARAGGCSGLYLACAGSVCRCHAYAPKAAPVDTRRAPEVAPVDTRPAPGDSRIFRSSGHGGACRSAIAPVHDVVGIRGTPRFCSSWCVWRLTGAAKSRALSCSVYHLLVEVVVQSFRDGGFTSRQSEVIAISAFIWSRRPPTD